MDTNSQIPALQGQPGRPNLPSFGSPTNPHLDEIKAHLASMSPGAQASIHQAFATGVSNPPDSGAVRSISPPIQDPQAHPPVPPIGAGPQTESPKLASTVLPPRTPLPAPSGSMQAPPPIPPPGRGTLAGDQAEQSRLLSTGSGISQIHSKIEAAMPNHPLLGKVLGWGAQIPATLADTAASAVAPGITMNLPGTQYHHNALVRQDQRQLGQDVSNDEKQAQTAETEARTGLTNEQAAELPGKTRSEEALQAAQAQKELTPVEKGIDVQTYDFLTKKLGMTPQQAFQEMQQEKGEPGREQQAQLRGDTLEQQRQIAEENRKEREQFHRDSEADRAAQRELMGGKQDTAAKQQLFKVYQPVSDSAERMNVMAQNAEDALRGNQQAGLSLLSNHIGMTMGLVKGARINKEIYQNAEQSQPWLQGIKAHFSKDGYLDGTALSPGQISNMMDLAPGRLKEDTNKARSEAKYLGGTDDGPDRIPSKAVIRYYLFKNNGDKEKAKAQAAEDGWTVQGGSNGSAR
jgi:hypothetical protein